MNVNLTYVDRQGQTKTPWSKNMRAPRYQPQQQELSVMQATTTQVPSQQQTRPQNNQGWNPPNQNTNNQPSATAPASQNQRPPSYTNQDARNSYNPSQGAFDPKKSQNPWINNSKRFDPKSHFICYKCCDVFPYNDMDEHRINCRKMRGKEVGKIKRTDIISGTSDGKQANSESSPTCHGTGFGCTTLMGG